MMAKIGRIRKSTHSLCEEVHRVFIVRDLGNSGTYNRGTYIVRLSNFGSREPSIASTISGGDTGSVFSSAKSKGCDDMAKTRRVSARKQGNATHIRVALILLARLQGHWARKREVCHAYADILLHHRTGLSLRKPRKFSQIVPTVNASSITVSPVSLREIGEGEMNSNFLRSL
jgi:hypothetical protein